MLYVGLLSLVVAASVAAFWAQWRLHQERIEPRPWWRAWGSLALIDALFRPAVFTAEGRQWRVVLLASWAVFLAAAFAAASLVTE